MSLRGRAALSRVALLVILMGCSSAPAFSTSNPSVPADSSLGEGDVFEVRVFGEQQLSGSYQVSADGTIDFPFLGTLTVAGKDPGEVSSEIRAALRSGGFLKDPQVSVFVQQTNSKRVSVLGAVVKPGTLPLTAGMTVVEAVSQAGGFTALASKDETVVTRRSGKELRKFRVRVTDITRGEQEDFPLRPGDIVFVPERVF